MTNPTAVRNWSVPRKRLVRLAAVLALLMTALLVGGLLGAVRLVQLSARSDPFPRNPPSDVIALSSTVKADSSLDDQGEDRLRSAIDVVRRMPSGRLITTRVQRGSLGPVSDMGQRRLVTLAGLQLRWLVLDGVVHSTRDEALRLRALLADSAAAIVVVTSGAHTRRACATFEGVGFRVICRPAECRDDRDHVRQLYEYLYERLATWKYRREGWIR